jgi:hypothetical protein
MKKEQITRKEIKLTDELLQDLYMGKQVCYRHVGFEGRLEEIIITPPNHGMFISMEDLYELEKQTIFSNPTKECEIFARLKRQGNVKIVDKDA